jgi:hypothetical protein
MGILERRDWLLWAVSTLVWRVPGRPAIKMAQFSHTEAGSGLDMLEAAALTTRPDMRRKYFLHALDELRHAGLFRDRARALAGRRSRARAVLDDGGFIPEHGIRTADPLFQQMDETEFLAFVWVHERRGAQQFDVYADLMKGDADASAMFQTIARDERFHIAYSRTELDRLARAGHGAAVRTAILRIRLRRAWQGWLRFSRWLGDAIARVWLALLYAALLGPFALVARWSERTRGGLQPPEPDDRPLALRAREPA